MEAGHFLLSDEGRAFLTRWMMRHVTRRAFTLIELLVVVAIIALLIALMMPQLSKAKEVTRRTSCAANLHALGIGYYAYISEFNNFLPIGVSGGFICNTWANDFRDGSYLVYTQAPGTPPEGVAGFKGLGMPAAIGAFAGANGPYFCPSAMLNMPPQRLPHYNPNDSDHGNNLIWPPTFRTLTEKPWTYVYLDAEGNVRHNWGGKQAVATYSVRATVPVDAPAQGLVWYNMLPQSSTDPNRFYDKTKGVLPGYVYDKANRVQMPKSSELRSNTVIASDFVCGGPYLNIVHRDGVNALRLDGSAGWIPRGVIEPHLSTKGILWQTTVAWGQADLNGPGDGEGNMNANYKKLWDLMDIN